MVVFGETGVGKSSIINMIAGSDVAETTSHATGCTFQSTSYIVDIGGSSVRLWDTAGLNEGDEGTVAAKNAITNLYSLLRGLEEGVSLLVYCVRGPRLKDSTVKNYQMFHKAFCQEKVPIILVVTGLEEEAEECMDDWWPRNKAAFQKQQMHFRGQACITSTKGKMRRGGHVYQEEYEESRKKVKKLIRDTYLAKPWKMEVTSWSAAVARSLYKLFTTFFKIQPLEYSKILYTALVNFGGFTANEAKAAVKEAELEARGLSP